MAKRKGKQDSFKARWLTRQHECGQTDLGPPNFLSCGGGILPDEAAPFLTFDQAEIMPRLWKMFGPKDKWSTADKKLVDQYRMIGSDSSGNPICIEDETGLVWMLDHEDNFRTRQFVNSSVSLLADCLLACMGEQDRYNLLAAIKKLDLPAAAKNAFWNEAAANLKNPDE